MKTNTTLYEDRRFKVTLADIRTPTMFYPLSDAVGRRRRDLLYAALSYCAVISLALVIYFDLWYLHERILMLASMAAALLIGTQVSLLQIDARGFPPRIFAARSKTVKEIFNAITEARAKSVQAGGGIDPDEIGDGE